MRSHAAETFRLIGDFLRENPNEVISRPPGPRRPRDAIDALERGGLADRAYPWRPGEELPTLGDMIAAGRNVLVLAEQRGGAEPWYIPAFEMIQETPFKFPAPDDFSCDPNRGDDASPLLMVNHWVAVDPPNPAAAAEVNARDVLLPRARRCADERDRHPEHRRRRLLRHGDLFDVVRELNGVS